MSKCEKMTTQEICENCIHFDVCEWAMIKKNCSNHKDKSLCVELPCKIGEYIGKIKDGKFDCDEINGIRIGKETITIYTKKKYYPIKLNEYDVQRIENAKIISYCDFYCAKSKEDAEKELKKRYAENK